jgi:hypothetical protein
VATFGAAVALPTGWRPIGTVVPGVAGEADADGNTVGDVLVDGKPYAEGGFDHFRS